VVHVKTLEISIGDSIITFDHVDAEINCPRKAHLLANGLYVFTQVVRDMKAIVVHLSSHVDLCNSTPIPFSIFVKTSEEAIEEIGTCPAMSEIRKGKGTTLQAGENDTVSRQSAGFGVPIHKLQALNNRAQRDDGRPSAVIVVSPLVEQVGESPTNNLFGEVVLPSLGSLVQIATGNSCVQSFEVTCTPRSRDRGQQQDAVTVQICCRVTLVGSYHPFVELFLQPRALFQNNLPVSVMIRTPMPHTFSAMTKQVPVAERKNEDETYFQDIGLDVSSMAGQTIHVLQPFETLKILTPGPSIALAALCADQPTGGRRTGWMDGGWVDVPLGRSAQLLEPYLCLFPFIKRGGESPAVARGSEFLILEGTDALPHQREEEADRGGRGIADPPKKSMSSQELRNAPSMAVNPNDPTTHIRTLSIGVQNYAVDHTGDILFEQVAKASATSPTRASSIHSGGTPHRRSFHPPHLDTIPFSAFSSPYHQKRITLLPASDVPVRILKLTMEGDVGTKRSSPFTLEEIPLSEGGIESKAITWADENRSTYFAFRRLSSANQYELHVIPVSWRRSQLAS